VHNLGRLFVSLHLFLSFYVKFLFSQSLVLALILIYQEVFLGHWQISEGAKLPSFLKLLGEQSLEAWHPVSSKENFVLFALILAIKGDFT